jgi:hypothetical protein
VGTAMQKSNRLSVSFDWHGGNRTLSTELHKLYAHGVGKRTQAALFHDLEGLL